jgi:hypothetical protein
VAASRTAVADVEVFGGVGACTSIFALADVITALLKGESHTCTFRGGFSFVRFNRSAVRRAAPWRSVYRLDHPWQRHAALVAPRVI